MRTKQVLVIRKDLRMRRGKEISQGAHGSLAILTNILIGYPFKWYLFPFNILKFIYVFSTHAAFREWHTSMFTKICVSVDSEEELVAIYEQAKKKGILCSLITDAGLTEFKGVPTKTVVAIGPDFDFKIDPITKHLKLY